MSKHLSQTISLLAIIALFFVLSFSFLPVSGLAATPDPSTAESYVPPENGLVNCGRGTDGPMSCTLVELLKLIDSVMTFFMYAIIFPISIMLIIYAGGRMAYYASWQPNKSAEAKKILIDVLIGFAIIFSAYVVVSQIFGYFLGDKADGPVKQAIDQVFGSN